MLRSVEITSELTGAGGDGRPFHNLGWGSMLELRLDCFVCERVGRTVELEYGQERAVCTSSSGKHFIPARITAFDKTATQDVLSLRAIVEYWWAPFHDAKDDKPGMPLTANPWVRLHLAYLCPEPLQPGDTSLQTNLVRPAYRNCDHCGTPLGVDSAAPTLKMLS
jgi:hypothetical protein